MPKPRTWTCDSCKREQPDAFICVDCGAVRFPTWSLMLQTHITELLADGIVDPVSLLAQLRARPCYHASRAALTIELVTRYARLLTKDTTKLARDIVKARSAQTMLEVLEHGEPKDKIQVLAKWGPETNADRLEHTGQGGQPIQVTFGGRYKPAS